MKSVIRIVSALVVVFAALMFTLYVLSNPMSRPQRADRVQPYPDLELLQAHVRFLTELQPPRQLDHPESVDKAAAYIRSEFEKLGLKVIEQKFTAKQNGKEYRNLEVRLGPAEGGAILIGAHYDVCGDQPGADDNASGVAGLLELARIVKMHETELKRPIILVAWTLEEPPSYDTEDMGSLVHAKLMREQNQKIDLMISLEMIGYFSNEPGSQTFPVPILNWIYPTTGNYVAVVGRIADRAMVKKIKTIMLRNSDIDVQSINALAAIPGIDYSDHRSYWAQGYPGVMVTDTAFYRNFNYHEKADSIEKLDFNRMAQVVEAVFGVIREY
jgi:Zn-dependent M28 family amino/carboxypeptidase